MGASSFWDDRYAENETVYGLQPNAFFREFIEKTRPGTLLLPCEGEGRNALYAAKRGWQVDAFDFSRVAVEKALERAKNEQVSIQYEQKSIEDFIPRKKYKLVASIYVHMDPSLRKNFHQNLIDSLEDGGFVILEAFNKNQVKYHSGGPKTATMLYSIDELLEDFGSLKIQLLEEKIIDLNEGSFHKGEAAVIRMIATR